MAARHDAEVKEMLSTTLARILAQHIVADGETCQVTLKMVTQFKQSDPFSVLLLFWGLFLAPPSITTLSVLAFSQKCKST